MKMKPRRKKPKDKSELEEQASIWFDTYFCGCGEPEFALDLFREFMAIFKEWEDSNSSLVCLDLDLMRAFESKHGKGITMLLLYFIDGLGLSEHGGSVYGCWLTDLGVAVKERSEVMTEEDL